MKQSWRAVRRREDELLTRDDSRRAWAVVRPILVDYYYFLALIAFFVLVWPALVACHHIDRRFGTRSTEGLVRFCERF